MLEVTTSRKYTAYITESAALARLIHHFFRSLVDPSDHVDLRAGYGNYMFHTVTITRRAEFNYILTKS